MIVPGNARARKVIGDLIRLTVRRSERLLAQNLLLLYDGKMALSVDEVVKYFLHSWHIALVEFCISALVASNPVEPIIFYFKSASPEAS